MEFYGMALDENLLRADMEACTSRGGKDSSSLRQQGDSNESNWREVPVMYGYGYDIHIASLMAIAKLMIEVKGYWSGTLICLFQPNEEGGTGVQAMVDDGLYDRVPVPDVILD
jgi:metal-dependent amidase/aminoacylase/carboxypeptidase family protein